MDQTDRNSAKSTGTAPTGGFAALVPELDVTNLEASLDFWCGIIGFEIAYERKAAKFAYLQLEHIQIMLCQISGEWITGPLVRPFGRGVNLQMQVSRLEPIIDKIALAKWPLYREIEEKRYMVGQNWRICKEMLIQDPDGYLIRFASSI